MPQRQSQEKMRHALLHSPKLQERIASQIKDFGGITVYDYEKDRFESVVRKLAFGHLAYENDALSWGSTYRISMWLLHEMSDAQKHSFFMPYKGSLLPEVGSHSLEHIVLNTEENVQAFTSPWITVQENCYRYCVSPDSNKVKFLIADFLAVEVQVQIDRSRKNYSEGENDQKCSTHCTFLCLKV